MNLQIKQCNNQTSGSYCANNKAFTPCPAANKVFTRDTVETTKYLSPHMR
jgi:hypothetical protein